MHNINICKIVQDWVNEVEKEAMINIDNKNKVVTICTQYPGYFIGYKGSTFDKFTKDIIKNGYKVKFLAAQEHFKPGDDWDKICEERARAFFETEYND